MRFWGLVLMVLARFVPWAAGLDADQIIEFWAKVFEVIGFIVALCGRITAKALISGLTGRT
ncbi:MAG: hypothetical protein HY825_14190 [Acidobacteria bacterium]|nr:hypothetical protein [Acidobacteriota bacterium]